MSNIEIANPANRVIVPLDVPGYDAAIILLDRLPDVTFWKVGLELFVSDGARILSELKARQKQVFLDLKFHDIPNTMAGAARAAGRYGVDLLTVHACAGSSALQATQAAAIEGATQANVAPPSVIAVTLLTSIAPEQLSQELKVSADVKAYAEGMAQLAKNSGLAGAVCSPLEASSLRELCGPDFVLVCPGVRPSWAAKGDQSRVMTPSEAIAAGATYLVIGRPITQAEDPAIAWQQILDELS
ncbi:MAG: orotidine-5'-phosphate decarboxylase [Cyanobacteria bacterium P01_D01_bin.73]